MPQREPLSPPLLAVACVLAAIPAAWLALSADALVAGAVGALAGFPWTQYGTVDATVSTVSSEETSTGSCKMIGPVSTPSSTKWTVTPVQRTP